MEVRYPPDLERYARMSTAEIRQSFLLADLFAPGQVKLIYSHIDRMIVGSAMPTAEPLPLEAGRELAADYFAQRREVGVLNIGGDGQVKVDGTEYPMANQDVLYIGRGSREIKFASQAADRPARFYLVSLPAHLDFPTHLGKIDEAEPVHLGSQKDSNQRTIYKFIHPDGIKSCQLVMGFTHLAEGNVWNTMPAHTHERRSEVYMYFGLDPDAVVFHLMGPGEETRHIVVRDGQAVLSPSWSLHAGAGTRRYSFCWAMGGENQAFNDMDGIAMETLA